MSFHHLHTHIQRLHFGEFWLKLGVRLPSNQGVWLVIKRDAPFRNSNKRIKYSMYDAFLYRCACLVFVITLKVKTFQK